MNIVNAGADFCFEVVFLEAVKDGKLRARGFEGNDVGVHRIDFRDNIFEFAIAHVSVDLGFRLDLGAAKSEGLNCEIEIFFVPIGAT